MLSWEFGSILSHAVLNPCIALVSTIQSVSLKSTYQAARLLMQRS